ncbi:hypothetical protein GPECTOR_61g782 [Gonium pectorale]|uniref:Uncharacterized protein n=1 Tax=Gonium pectorale TaxID=33097 RepID=A0A150G4L3_GONPE|nr:hypothetical protein GPECTOR_61g782 [Gonium pectorale]|eukprot:KXZ44829.1 hypothetical protein GPECTOR_61g782 [Gonium pectorale]
MDRSFLDAAFALLASLADRQPALAAELRLKELAAGEPAETLLVPEPASGLVAGEEELPAGLDEAAPSGVANGTGDGPPAPGPVQALFSTAEQLADFFLSPELQCKLAAGQLLYGLPYGKAFAYGNVKNVVCGASAEGFLGGPALQATQGEVEVAEAQVMALCEVPALAELCAAAAASEAWPELVRRLAEGGPAALAAWLECGVQQGWHPDWEGQSGEWRDAIAYGCGGDGGGGVAQRVVSATCCGLLAAALRRQPGVVLASVPAPLVLLLLAAEARRGDGTLRLALLSGLASLLEPTPSPPLSRDSLAVAQRRGGAPGLEDDRLRGGAGEGRHGSGSGGGDVDGKVVPCLSAVPRLHACCAVVGLDLGSLLQQHLLATDA